MMDEARAVDLARRGDDAAWRFLYERYADFVFRMADRVVGNHAAALDVVQDTFVRAARSLDGFRGEGSFRGWLARIAVNQARDELRRRSRRREASLEAASAAPDTAPLPDERSERAELARRAMAFAHTLPEKQREALLLRVTEGLSFAEVGEALGSSEGSARVSYHYALQKLRAHMAEPEGAGPAAGERGSRR